MFMLTNYRLNEYTKYRMIHVSNMSYNLETRMLRDWIDRIVFISKLEINGDYSFR